MEGGTKARITVDLNGASLDSDANPIGSLWQTLKNVLTDLPGVLRKRGAISYAGSSTAITGTASSPTLLAFYDGPILGAATYQPYVAYRWDSPSTFALRIQNSTGAPVEISSTERTAFASKCPTINEILVMPGVRYHPQGGLYNAAEPTLYGGADGSVLTYSAGTVTVAAGSDTVTGAGTTWTSSMIGMFFRSTPDSAAYESALYRVVAVNSTTELRLDRGYAGDSAGAGKAYSLDIVRQMYATASTPFSVAGSGMPARVAASAWSRLVLANTNETPGTAISSVTSRTALFPTRVRWSGAIGSDEGVNAAAYGMWSFDANAHVDLNTQFGQILALAPSRDFVLAFQESGLTVIRGAPVYDGAGSLDISEIHRGVAINSGFAFEATPQGVFFFDKNVGPCVYDGARVQRLGDARVTRTMLPYGITAVGYYDGKVLFSGTTTAGVFVFDTATAQWSFQSPPYPIYCLVAGRTSSDHDVVGVSYDDVTDTGCWVVNLANMFDAPGTAATDWDGTAFTVDIKTGKLGDTLTHLRPERAYITYRLTDLTTTNPYLSTTITTGLPDTSDSQHTYTCAATDLIETTDVETKRLEISMSSDPMAQVRVLQNNAAGKLELYSLVIDCCVEGEGASS
jgi:hypothetical protein